MHSMPNVAEDTTAVPQPVQPTFGPPRVITRKPRIDAVLAESVDVAQAALQDFADDGEIGEHLGAVADDERVVTHRFTAYVAGYSGWHFYVTLARAPRSKVVTVSEIGMLPGDDAILAPEWVPWRDRASEEERIRLDAIAAGEDPVKALEAAGYGPEVIEEQPVTTDEKPAVDDENGKKQARRDAKRRRARQQAARKRRKKKSAASDKTDSSDK